MKRRDFIKNGCAACLSITALPLLVSSCAALSNTTGKMVKDGLILNTDDFKMVDKGNTTYKSSLIIRNDALLFPVCVYRFSNTAYSALWMKCSHQGAELQASGDYLQCPAHGSEFNNEGEVTSGPAANNLRTFPVSVNGKEIFIDMRKQS